MVVNPEWAAVGEGSNAVTGEMDFPDNIDWQRCNVGRCVPFVIVGTDADVIDVAKNAAAGARGDRGHKLPFGNDGIAESDVSRRVFDQDAPLEISLGLVDVTANHVQRLFCHRQWQKIREVLPASDIPRDVFGHQSRLDALGDLSDAFKVRSINAFGASQR